MMHLRCVIGIIPPVTGILIRNRHFEFGLLNYMQSDFQYVGAINSAFRHDHMQPLPRDTTKMTSGVRQADIGYL